MMFASDVTAILLLLAVWAITNLQHNFIDLVLSHDLYFNSLQQLLLSPIVFKPFPNERLFLRVCSISVLKTLWEKEKLLVTSNFSFSNRVFYPFEELSAINIKFKTVVCRLFQFWKSLKLVVWKRVI